MKSDFILRFDEGMPKGTAQEKGECIRYKIENGKRVPYIHHFKKDNVDAMRREFELKLKRFRPARPSDAPIRLTVFLFFDIKTKKLWGQYKTKRPDADNYIKELKDAMTTTGFWHDDAQVADLRIVKKYAEKASIYIRVEEMEA
jgi:Holliday junction resolvase RusA-like endonuclease